MGEVPSWTVGELPQLDLRGNYLRVVFTNDVNSDIAEDKGDEMIATYLIRRAGVSQSLSSNNISDEETTTVATNRSSKSTSHTTKRYNKKVTVDGKTYGRYCLLDKYVQFKGGRYYFAGLYLIAENDMSLAYVPPITYGMDLGAWRSLIVPGWAQFYQGRTGAGIAFLGLEAGLIGTAAFFQNKVSVNRTAFNNAQSVDVKQVYKQRYDQAVLFRNIAAGASIAWYAYNAIDAFTSKKGKLYYTVAYGQGYLSFSPAPMAVPGTGELGFGLACNFSF